MIFAKSSHPHPGLLRGRRLPARRPRALPLRARHPARPRRADPRHRARALALRRRHHDPHLRSRRRRGAGPLRARSRSSTGSPTCCIPARCSPTCSPCARASAAGTGRSWPGSATATTWPTAGSTPPAASASSSGSPAPRATSPNAEILRAQPGKRTSIIAHRRPARGGARRPRRQHRRLGLDGPGGGAGGARQGLPGLHRGRAR